MFHLSVKFVIIFVVIAFNFDFVHNQHNDSKEYLPTHLLSEINEVRKQLNEAFEKYDNRNKEEDIVDQPSWTLHQNITDNDTHHESNLEDSLKEAAQIRKKIQTAIANNITVSSVHNVLEDLVGKIQPEEINNEPDDVIDNENNEMVDMEKLHKFENFKDRRRVREELILESIEEDLSFTQGEGVNKWAYVLHDGQEYFIGCREIDLIIILKEAINHYEEGHILNIGRPIAVLETFSFWNYEKQMQQGVILIAVQGEVLWHLGNGNAFWHWTIGGTITALTHFKVDDSLHYLAIATNHSSPINGYYAINIFQFNLSSSEFWIVQHMEMMYPCDEIKVLDTGRDILLAVAQHNVAAIYKHNPRIDNNLRFQHLKTISSEGIQTIAAFQMGGRSYLALGGWQSQILLYNRITGNLVPTTKFQTNFGLVELFFPIPLRTYRDDLILLIQHRLDFATHDLSVLEALIWNGETFEVGIPAPCNIGNHTIYGGVNCMLDIQFEAGLKGATLLQYDNSTSILIPRHQAESGLFRIHTKLLEKNSEFHDLQEIFTFLKDWVQEQDNLINEIEKMLNEKQTNDRQDYSNLKILETPEFEFDGKIDEIYINSWKWTAEDSSVSLEFLNETIKQLENELNEQSWSKKNEEQEQDEVYFENMEFDEIHVKHLHAENLNGNPAYINNNQLIFDGILNLKKVKVLDDDDGMMVGDVSGPVPVPVTTSESIFQDYIEIDGDLEFDEINGVVWKDFIRELVFCNVPLSLDNLTVNGEVFFNKSLIIDSLNGMRFPDDYLWTNEATVSASIIRARKEFLNYLAVDEIDTDNNGLINDINPFDLITLSYPQAIPGMTTFGQLRVSERFELNGTVRAKKLDKYLSNPSILSSDKIQSVCNFYDLKVNGTIYINGKYNNQNFTSLLEDVITIPINYDGEEILIRSKKNFTSTISFPSDFVLTENKISGILVENFVTKNTDQILEITKIDGYVFFDNLTIGGTFDDVNITQLIDSSIDVRKDEIALTNVDIRFTETVYGSSVIVLEQLNGVSVRNGFQNINENFTIEEATFENLYSDEIQIDGNVKVSGSLKVLDLNEQPKPSVIFIDELILEEGLQTNEIFGIPIEFFFHFLEKVDDIPTMILDGNINIDSIFINGDVKVNKLNGIRFDEDIQMNAIWLNQTNFLQMNLKFSELVEVYGNLSVEGHLNNINFPYFLEDMIFKNTNYIPIITAPKIFLQNVTVLENAIIPTLNGIPFASIVTKNTKTPFEGTIYINGNLIVNELDIGGTLNNYSMTKLNSLYRYDEYLDTFVRLGKVSFPDQIVVDNLVVFGHINDIHITEFLDNVVYKNESISLQGMKTFTGNVTIENGAYIENLNGHNMVKFFENIVLTSQPTTVHSPVLFQEIIHANTVAIQKSLKTDNLQGCLLSEWLNNSIRLDQPFNFNGTMNFEAGSLDGNRMIVDLYNGINISNLITLNTEQNFSNHLKFSEVHLTGSLQTQNGLVNGFNLQAEMENTLMTFGGDQRIATPLLIKQKCVVLESLHTNTFVNNGKDLRNVATITDDLELHSPITFNNLTAHNTLSMDLISGINFTDWHRKSLWQKGRQQQKVTGEWQIKKLNLKTKPPDDSAIEYIRPKFMNESSQLNREILRENQKQMCQQIMNLLKKYRERTYYPKYLNFAMVLSTNRSTLVNRVFTIQFVNESYLIVNYGCYSQIYQWNSQDEIFTEISKFESGPIDQILGMRSRNKVIEKPQLLLITNAGTSTFSENCSRKGLNSWKLHHNVVSHFGNYSGMIGMIYKNPFDLDSDLFYAIDDERHLVIQLNWNLMREQKYWSLPEPDYVGAYRFFPTGTDQKITISDGNQIILLDNSDNKILIKEYQHIVPRTESHSTTIDFQQKLQQLLSSSLQRIDELVRAPINKSIAGVQREKIFIILNAIRELNMSMVNITGSEIDSILKNPTQLLVIQTMDIILPLIVEIEEMKHFTHDDRISSIFNSTMEVLRSFAEDETTLAEFSYSPIERQTTEISSKIDIMARIRSFQQDIEIEINKIKRSYLPSPDAGQILAMHVGPITKPKQIFAVIESKGYSNSVKIYSDLQNGILFQEIPSNNPQFIAAIRVNYDTLFAFVEGHSTVRVMIYRGIQGFVHFSMFQLNDEIIGLNAINTESHRGPRLFFIVTDRRNIKFYEVVLNGNGDIVIDPLCSLSKN